MGIKESKCIKLARFLIEPESSTSYTYNAMLQAKSSLILENLKKLVGQFYLYGDSDTQSREFNIIKEDDMKKLLFESFSRSKQTL